MQFTPTPSEVERSVPRIIEQLPPDEILVRITELEEFNFRSHAHSRHQLVYILSGTLHIEVEGISHFVTDRHLVWIPRGVAHRLSSNNRRISLLTSYFCMDGIEGDAFAVYRTDELVAGNLRYISSCTAISRGRNPELHAFAVSFFRLLPQLCPKASFPTQLFIVPRDSRLRPVLEYVRANLGRDLSIGQVAAHFGFSVRNLTRMFTDSGIRFVHYLNYHRVVRAIELLADGAMNIEQTAYEVGFNSPGSFSRVFKQVTGESPSAYLRHG